MKGLFILAFIATIAVIFLQWKKTKNHKKAILAIASIGAIISLGVMGNLTRSVMPIYLAHLILLISAWGAVIWYLVKDKYYWWVIGSPILTIGLFLLMETLTGSGHEAALIS